MHRPTLFISDLHLCPADAATVAAFRTFLRDTASQAAALYILGDLFEYWLGDDQLDDVFYGDIARQIAALQTAGVAVFFMAGNRDFLPSKRFAREAGLTILPDPSIIKVAGQQILLAHGDAYCTDDLDYQRYRKLARNPIVQWIWLHLPKKLRNQEAAKLRAKSMSMNQRKSMAIMDVNSAAIQAELIKYTTQVLIHGHTHKPSTHIYPQGQRWVLPDWHQGEGGYLRLDEHGLALYTLHNQPFAVPQVAA
ncbi:UDP-2,3-diacylglucosamine diphosphatase [Chitinibacter bivalviorum]|uniref:UDP-2,3-diacylglucosamine hydrolase n=1 Tax=Chitinibacter bivalviorum TaxID=2739434 RepID=A0A7H9BEX3_9NEIS|nr:UDP-2,3-diacylglucosamine diphosphatase [Chitinibacter bivalviorum]QLG86962.1 UDP-2,3-diacylglucosamine diphosphatase [Chitinibacter bivalviorum]